MALAREIQVRTLGIQMCYSDLPCRIHSDSQVAPTGASYRGMRNGLRNPTGRSRATSSSHPQHPRKRFLNKHLQDAFSIAGSSATFMPCQQGLRNFIRHGLQYRLADMHGRNRSCWNCSKVSLMVAITTVCLMCPCPSRHVCRAVWQISSGYQVPVPLE